MSYLNLQVVSPTFLLRCHCVYSRFDAKFKQSTRRISCIATFMIAQCCHNFHFKISRSPARHLAVTDVAIKVGFAGLEPATPKTRVFHAKH